MRLSLRFIIPLATVLTLIAYNVVPLVDDLTLKWFVRDIEIRAGLIASTMEDSLVPLIASRAQQKVGALFSRVVLDERLYAVGFCNKLGQLEYKSETFSPEIKCPLPVKAEVENRVLNLSKGSLHIAFRGLKIEGSPLGYLVLVHDMSFAQQRSEVTKRYIFLLFIAIGAVVSLITVLIAQISWRGWVSGMRALVKGGHIIQPATNIASPEFRPIIQDLRTLVKDLESGRKTRDESRVSWSPGVLKEILQRELVGDEILIVSNREPYIHVREGDKVIVQEPASGLVTALEPIMRACSGTWIAHGSGNADREVVDQNDHVPAPPGHPSYRIRRVWLTKEEEKGYYYGFSNEGLWPLCHNVHTRPIFRSEDWNYYIEINRRFAKTVAEEAKTDDPVVLVQDYHFALLPRMIKEHLPNATIITFWHIPWPNSEAFGICPWREEILSGLLGSSIIGFHTRFHCNNFIETVDRFLECRIDRETSMVSYGGKHTAINRYPISIEFPPRRLKEQKSIPDCRDRIRQINKIPPDRKIGIGIDRLDYTKGIVERFLAVEKLFERNPGWIGNFTFIQIAAPSRSSIENYIKFEAEVRKTAEKINARFSTEGYEPICLKIEHHGADQVLEYYRGSDICFVSSLHDGMNLVAKEFVAAKEDNRGVLILSQFAGASRELLEALIVNPYDIDQCADALNSALEMSEREQRDRMVSMRNLVKEFNVYRWAGRMLIDAAQNRRHNRFKDRIEQQNQ
jgi:trehalose 6-phosphate synthase